MAAVSYQPVMCVCMGQSENDGQANTTNAEAKERKRQINIHTYIWRTHMLCAKRHKCEEPLVQPVYYVIQYVVCQVANDTFINQIKCIQLKCNSHKMTVKIYKINRKFHQL